MTKAEGPHGERRHVGTQCLFVNPCTQSRNTLMETLVQDPTLSCKHRSDTLGTLRHKVQMRKLCVPTHTLIFESNTIKPFSGFFVGTCLNMERSLNINSGYIKAVLCSTSLLRLCRLAAAGHGVTEEDSKHVASLGLIEHNTIDCRPLLPPPARFPARQPLSLSHPHPSIHPSIPSLVSPSSGPAHVAG